MDCSPPGFSICGILQARTLEWVAISFSNAWKWKVKVKSLSRVRLLATPWTAAYHHGLQTPPSMGFSRQQYWSGVPLGSPFTFKSEELFKKLLADFGVGLALQFFYSVTRGGWFLWKQCFWEKGREMECFPLMCQKKEKWHAFILFRQLELFIPCWMCVQGFRGS